MFGIIKGLSKMFTYLQNLNFLQELWKQGREKVILSPKKRFHKRNVSFGSYTKSNGFAPHTNHTRKMGV